MWSDDDQLPDLAPHTSHTTHTSHTRTRTARVHCISSSDEEIYDSIKISSVYKPLTNSHQHSSSSASNENGKSENGGTNQSEKLLTNPTMLSSSDSEDNLPALSSRVRLDKVHCISSSDEEEHDKAKVSSNFPSKASSKPASNSKYSSVTSAETVSGYTSQFSDCVDSKSSRNNSQRTESSFDAESQEIGRGKDVTLKRSATVSSIDSQESSVNSPTKKARKKMTAEEKLLKQQLKDKQQEEKEAKKRVLEAEKQKKRLLQEARKHLKLGDCLKHLSVSIDVAVMNHSAGASILTQLQNAELRYEVRAHPRPSIISFWREVMEVKETDDHKVESISKEIVEDEILVYMPSEEFIPLVHTYQQRRNECEYSEDPTLCQFVEDTKQKLENRKITLIIQGMEKYFRGEKTKQQRAYRKQVAGDEGKTKNTKNKGLPNVARLEMEEALVDLQLRTGANVKFYETDEEVGKCVMGYAKAVAEAPIKREKSTTGFGFHISSGGSVKVERDGSGLARAWRQQVQQFKNVTAEVANAIVEVYRSPVALYQAYAQCSTEKEAELLLQDVEVRRGVGVMATTRRVGKELSRRFYQLMTATDGDFVIV